MSAPPASRLLWLPIRSPSNLVSVTISPLVLITQGSFPESRLSPKSLVLQCLLSPTPIIRGVALLALHYFFSLCVCPTNLFGVSSKKVNPQTSFLTGNPTTRKENNKNSCSITVIHSSVICDSIAAIPRYSALPCRGQP